jgi:methylenetetrahydrofolate reductase (NADPH)
MSLFSPRRYQAPFRTVQRQSLPLRVMSFFELLFKGALFSCRMCGNCILQETAMICPMTCPKGLRNGLCGGATPEHCEVDPSRPCTWYLIYQKSERLGTLDKLLEINAPLDGNQVGKEQWTEMVKIWLKRGRRPRPQDFLLNREQFNEEWEAMFYEVRQPEWWEGDSQYHPPAYTEPISVLEASLRTGTFVTTAEIAPPLSASVDTIHQKAEMLKPYVTAANFTDNASSTPRMGSLASSKVCLDIGLEPVMQLQARDRTRVVIESDALGAAGVGIRNILCLTGDHHRFGPAPMNKPDQFDMDAVQMLWMLRRMRDEGKYIDGRALKFRPQWFLGAASSPFGVPPKYEALRVEKKVNAGAQFIQTQPVFDYDMFVDYMEALDKRNLLDKVYILAGLVPLKSARAAHFMDCEVPGVFVTPEVLRRMDEAGDKDAQQAEGVAIALELIEKIKGTAGLSGIHIMAVHWESIVPRLVEESGLPRPVLQELPQQEPAGASS